MQVVSSYGAEIKNKNIPIRHTLALYREAVRCLTEIYETVLGHEIDLVIDIPAQGAERSHDGFIIRRNAIETGVTVLTAVDTARALVTSMENRAKELTLINIAEI